MDMKGRVVLPVIASVLILGALGFSQEAYGNSPTIGFTSATPSSGIVGVGNTVTVVVTETASSQVGLTVVSATINGVDVSGAFTDNADGTYSFTYTVAEGDPDIADAANLPMSIILEDAAGNNSNTLGDIASGSAPGINGGGGPVGGTPLPVGGTPLPIDTTSLLLAGAYTTASWMIPVLVSAIGFGILISRKL